MYRRTIPILSIPEINVAIGIVPGLVQGDPTLVPADRSEAETPIVLENKFSLVIASSITVQVEMTGISFVANYPEGLSISAPSEELGLELLTGGQIFDRTVRLVDENMIEFVAALVRGVEESVVAREPANTEYCVLGGARELLPIASS